MIFLNFTLYDSHTCTISLISFKHVDLTVTYAGCVGGAVYLGGNICDLPQRRRRTMGIGNSNLARSTWWGHIILYIIENYYIIILLGLTSDAADVQNRD